MGHDIAAEPDPHQPKTLAPKQPSGARSWPVAARRAARSPLGGPAQALGSGGSV